MFGGSQFKALSCKHERLFDLLTLISSLYNKKLLMNNENLRCVHFCPFPVHFRQSVFLWFTSPIPFAIMKTVKYFMKGADYEKNTKISLWAFFCWQSFYWG